MYVAEALTPLLRLGTFSRIVTHTHTHIYVSYAHCIYIYIVYTLHNLANVLMYIERLHSHRPQAFKSQVPLNSVCQR